jgi:tetratricopeptide (TPR) repeat protein
VLLNLASAYDEMELFSQALESVQTAEGVYQQLLTSTATKETELRWLRALLVKGQLLDRLDQAELAERAYRDVVGHLDSRMQSGDVTTDCLIVRATADEYLGRFLRKRGRTGEARGYLEHGMAIRQALLCRQPSPARAKELAILADELVSCWRDEYLLEPACLCIDRAIVALTSQGELCAQPSVSTNLVHLLLQRALLRSDLGTYIGVLADLDQVSTLGPPQSLAGNMMALRARCLAHLGRHREAAAIVEDTLPRIGDNPDALYDAAAALAVSARHVNVTTADHGQDSPPSQSNNYSEAAWQVLERLREIGYFRNSVNRQRWLADPQFAFLRGQSEFAEFLRRLHAEQSHQ